MSLVAGCLVLATASPSALAAKAAQTITFAQPAASAYGSPAFAIAATASSGLPVIVASLTAATCSIDGMQVTPLNAGTCKLRASQAGDATWAAAPSITRSVTVAKASQSIAFPIVPGKVFGDPPFDAAASSSAGLPVAVTSTTAAVCSITAGKVTILKAGTCTLKATQAGDANHAAATAVSQSIVVAKAPQSITFEAPPSRSYGDPPFAVAATSSSGLAVSVASTTKSVCTVAGMTVSIVGAGTCKLRATQAGNGNFLAASPVDQSLAIAKQGQAITFDPVGDQPISTGIVALSASASSGLSVAFASLTKSKCTVSGSTATLVATGTCTIRASQAGDANHPAATPVDQSFQVTREAQVLDVAALNDVSLSSLVVHVSASSSAGLAPGFASLTPATCDFRSPPDLALLAAGTCTIKVSQGGNAAYLPAADVLRSFAITDGGPATVHFDDPGPHLLAESPLVPGAYSLDGMSIVYRSSTPAVCVATDSMLDLVAPGTCTATAFDSSDGILPRGTGITRSFTVLRSPRFGDPLRVAIAADASRLIAVPKAGGTGAVLVAAGTSQIDEVIPDGSGGFSVAASIAGSAGFLRGIAAGPIDGDGRIDVAASAAIPPSAAWIYTHLNRGDGSFESTSTTLGLGMAAGLAIADVDGDGNADVLVGLADAGATQGSSYAILYGSGDGRLSGGTSYPLCGNPWAIAVADLDDDGLPDFVATCARDDAVVVMHHRDGAGFELSSTIPGLMYVYAIAAADLDGDGEAEIVVGTRSGVIHVLATDDAGGYALANSIWTGGGTTLQVTDVNADGWPDIVSVDFLNQRIVVLAGAGPEGFAPPFYIPMSVRPDQAVAADLDGDGHLDLAVTSASDRGVWVFRGAAEGAVVATLAPLSPASQSAALGMPFASALAVRASDAAGQPVPGAEVRFSIATGSPSGGFGNGQRTVSVLTGRDGIARSPRVRAGRSQGSYAATAVAATASTLFSLTNLNAGVPPHWTEAQPPQGAIATPYSYAFVATGTPLPRISLDSGSLPPGLAISSAGLVTGTPTSADTYSGVLRASNGIAPEATVAFSISIGAYGQTISFDAIADQALGSSAVRVFAVASSGLPVVVASLTPAICVAGGDTVVFKSAGRCTVRATQTGDSQFAAASPVDRSFEIGRGSQTVSVTVYETSTRVDATPLPIVASATSGLPIALQSSTPLVCAVEAERLVAISRGTCTVEASQPGNASWAPARASTSINVAGALQRINLPLVVDQHLVDFPYLSVSATSGLPVTVVSTTPAICAVQAPNIVSISAPGAPFGLCVLTITQAGDGRFDPTGAEFSFVLGTPGDNPDSFHGNVPHIAYAGYLGGWMPDQVFGLVVGEDGAPIIAGTTASTNIPDIASRIVTNGGVDLVFLSKLRADSADVNFATATHAFWDKPGGGNIPELAGLNAIAISASGSVVVAGHEGGADFPQTGGTYRTYGALGVFIVDAAGRMTRLAPSLDPAIKTVRAIGADGSGSIFLTGVASAGLATTPGAAIASSAVANDAPYLIKLSGTGAVSYATYLTVPGSRAGAGAPSADAGRNDSSTTSTSLVIDAAGNAYVGGQSTARDFPASSGALDTPDHNNRDGFVVKVSPTGSSLAYVARLGFADQERITALALAPDGDLVFGGKSASVDNFVGGGGFQTGVWFSQNHMVTQRVDREFGFVGKLDPSGSTLRFLAGVGASGGDLVNGAFDNTPSPIKVAVDGNGDIHVAGRTYPDRSLPSKNLIEGMPDYGAFLMKITPNGEDLYYAVIVGDGRVTGLAVDERGAVYVAGNATGDMPTIDTQHAECSTGTRGICGSPFIVKVSDIEAPVVLTASPWALAAGDSSLLQIEMADATAAGTIEIRDSGAFVGVVPLSNGIASMALTPSFGFHRYTATYTGTGALSGLSSTSVLVQVMQRVLP